MIDNSYIRGYDYLLDSIKNYAIDHNLSGKDVLVTGYSQGGSVTNSMYSWARKRWQTVSSRIRLLRYGVAQIQQQ